jgi:hypothetical protein
VESAPWKSTRRWSLVSQGRRRGHDQPLSRVAIGPRSIWSLVLEISVYNGGSKPRFTKLRRKICLDRRSTMQKEVATTLIARLGPQPGHAFHKSRDTKSPHVVGSDARENLGRRSHLAYTKWSDTTPICCAPWCTISSLYIYMYKYIYTIHHLE